MLQETKNLLDSLQTPYKEGADYFSMSCPFAPFLHASGEDRSPSFVIYPTRDFAKCFSCGCSFSMEEFFTEYSKVLKKNIDFESISSLIILKKEEKELQNIILIEDILKGFKKDSPKIQKYLDTRGIERANIPVPILYDNKNKNLVTPIRNKKGQLLGATSRSLTPKGNKSHHYFGIITSKCLLGQERSDADTIMIVEGLTCLWNAYDNITKLGLSIDVYATLTASMSNWQANQVLSLDKPVVLAYDMDEAGQKGRKVVRDQLEDTYLTEMFWENKKLDIGNMSEDFFLRTFENRK